MEYSVLSEIEHVLKRPDTYVGSIDNETSHAAVFKDGIIRTVPCTWNPGLLHIFDEVLNNAVDNHIRRKGTTHIKVTMDATSITVCNNGQSIPLTTLEGEYLPTVLFGMLRSGSNFDDTSGRQTGGKNGLGVKLCNIFSTAFAVTVVHQKKKFTQAWSHNMSTRGDAHIAACRGADRVTVTFTPDLRRFGCTTLNATMRGILTKRCLDVVFCYPALHVSVNGQRYCKTPLQYLKCLSTAAPVVSQVPHWTVAVFPNLDSETDGQQLSFVNGIATTKGGTHVRYVLHKLSKLIATGLAKRKLKPSPKIIKDHLYVVVSTNVVNPAFESQTKSSLATRVTKFQAPWVPDDKFSKALFKSPVFTHLVEVFSRKQDKDLAKLDGKKTSRCNVPKLIDASWAGTTKSEQCTLLLAEGDSALSMLLKGVTANRLQKTMGLFPLKGKLLNCSTASKAKAAANAEIQHLKKALGLSHGRVYTDTKGLRYGRVLVATDADDDGMHILGLVLTMFQTLYPNLVQLGYVQRFVTPMITAKKGKVWREFFSQDAYDTWAAKASRGHVIKFYKGLGTSSNADAKRYFASPGKYMRTLDDPAQGLPTLDMFFGKDRMAERKQYVRQPSLPHVAGTLDGFVKGPLHAYARSSLARAIPSIDGFKESTRKIMYTCLQKNLYGEARDMKVSELAGLVSKFTQYHHGQTSLEGAIIGLARRFTTVNRVPLLVDAGQFGSYRNGGSDHASSRYVFTRLDEVCKLVFHKEDLMVLEKHVVEGVEVEPKLLAPVLPLVLLNGAAGIATGFSTSVYPYDPVELVDATLAILQDVPCAALVPCFRDWHGDTVLGDGFFTTTGHHVLLSPTQVKVKTLPVGTFPHAFEKHLRKLHDKNVVKRWKVDHAVTGVAYTVTFVKACDMASVLKLTTKHSLTNMHLLDTAGVLRCYDGPVDLLCAYVTFKLKVTARRRTSQMDGLRAALTDAHAVQRFVSLFLDGTLVLRGRSDDDVARQLRRHDLHDHADKLLAMPLRRLTQSAVDKAARTMVQLKTDLVRLRKTTARQMYERELQAFRAACVSSRKRGCDEENPATSRKRHRKKKI